MFEHWVFSKCLTAAFKKAASGSSKGHNLQLGRTLGMAALKADGARLDLLFLFLYFQPSITYILSCFTGLCSMFSNFTNLQKSMEISIYNK